MDSRLIDPRYPATVGVPRPLPAHRLWRLPAQIKLRVLVAERDSLIGGTSAISGGAIWILGTRQATSGGRELHSAIAKMDTGRARYAVETAADRLT